MENQQDHPVKTDVTRNPAGNAKSSKNWLWPLSQNKQGQDVGAFFLVFNFSLFNRRFGVAMYPTIKEDMGGDSKDHTAVIDVVGVIAEDKDSNAADIIGKLKRRRKRQTHQRHNSAFKFAGWQPCAIGLCLSGN